MSQRPLSDELLAAIADDPRCVYALARDAGIQEASLRRFVARQRSLTLESADKLTEALGLKLVRKPRARKKMD